MGENKKKKIIKKNGAIITLICIVFIIYIGITIFFRTHFYNTTIDGINMFRKSVEDAKDIISYKLDNYCVNINEEDQKTQYITGNSIGLKYDLGNQIEKIKDKENPFWCIAGMLKHNSYETNSLVTVDKELLKKSVDKIIELRSKDVRQNENAKIDYRNGEYIVVDERYGNIIDKNVLEEKITEAVEKLEQEINIEKLDCYTKPEYTSKSKEVLQAKDTLNKYLCAEVTYSFGNDKEILNKEQIRNWLRIDDKYEVYIDDKNVKEYIKTLANKYNTVGKEREFTTSLGNKIKVAGGSYGNKIDEDFEGVLLIEAIKNGKNISKEPEYLQKAASTGKNDIGNTYVEIDLSRQHLWFYKAGRLITEGDIVSGNVNNDCATPAGIYSLVYKQKDTVLKGQGYASPVNFWMPFNGGIGIHDASWRYNFGGDIYTTNGSHGCINAPYDLAIKIFNNIEPGTPVVCYHE
ncbi:L,D-transpeptidase family protein [Clostridium sp.]|uniref:L,D-transpeptidase family protein n=1 Tax=Clostridium sp. TaxID=1506 RepID=UPI00290D4FC4|nr:L,D-transpeptidase family protein [Clostridium sp.]MDU4848116.1 peptidoglycan binding domain-containing protein [Clostridium sp.]